MRRSFFLVVCALLVGAALVALVLMNRPSTPGSARAGAAGSTSVAVPTLPAKPTPPPVLAATQAAEPSATQEGSAELGTVLDMAFVDGQHGWLLGSSASGEADRPVVRATSDGGQTWQPAAAPPARIAWYPPDFGNNHSVRALRFAGAKDGWAFLPGLYSTHDGGQTWADETPDKDAMTALEAQGSSVWAVKRACPNPTQAAGCTLTLIASSDAGRTWHEAASPPSLPGPDVQLVRATADEGWVFSSGGEQAGPGASARLSRTSDGGKSWQALPEPPCPSQSTGRLAALPAGPLWLLCGGQPGAGQQLKSLYRSADGGATWQTVAGNPATQQSVQHMLPGSGYVAGLVATGPQRLWMVLQRGGVFGSADGGQTWQLAGPNVDWGDYSGVGPIAFAGAMDGWFSSYNKLYRTTDGGATWEGVEVR